MSRTPITMAGLVVVAALSLAGCGGETVVEGPAKSPTTASPTGSGSPEEDAPASAIVVVRTGGIAGVFDMVQVAADGTARIRGKTGETRNCTPSVKALDRLRAIDLTAVGTTRSNSKMADGFNYSVRSAEGSAAAGDGDDDGRHAELVDAAAAVIASCMANQSGSGSADK
jgi:hypothetical protein